MINGIQQVNPKDYLLIDSYEKLVGEIGSPRLKYCPLEHIPEFFQNKDEQEKPYVLVSGNSDYGLVEQAEFHPNRDLWKLANRVHWQKAFEITDQYVTVDVGPVCNKDKCNPGDKYSIKMDTWTLATFNNLPGNLCQWYGTNFNLGDNTELICLPFGSNADGSGEHIIPEYVGDPKKELCYINWQPFTLERIYWKNYFRSIPWVTFRQNANVPFRQYLDELSCHKFCVCPIGNGFDSYRVYECIYLGVIPILQESHHSRALLNYGLPIVLVDSFDKIKEEDLNKVWEIVTKTPFNYSAVTRSYWKGIFEKSIMGLTPF